MIGALSVGALGWGVVGLGAALAGRPYSVGGRPVGVALICGGALLLSSPAYADQSVMAADNGTIACTVSEKDLTRISLFGDKFASVSKIATGVPTEDFKIVNEPARGDIYLSVPQGFSKPILSFFGTSAKGFVYKFQCKVKGGEAEQIFITNASVDRPLAHDWEVATSPEDAAVRLAQAMYRAESLDGFAITQDNLEPVAVGKLIVQQVIEYRGDALKGVVLRVRNTGKTGIALDQNLLAARGTVAFMTESPELAPMAETAVYLVQANGRTDGRQGGVE